MMLLVVDLSQGLFVVPCFGIPGNGSFDLLCMKNVRKFLVSLSTCLSTEFIPKAQHCGFFQKKDPKNKK